MTTKGMNDRGKTQNDTFNISAFSIKKKLLTLQETGTYHNI